MVVQPDGRVLVGGLFTNLNGLQRNGLARLNANGTVDTSFAPQIGRRPDSEVTALALQADGGILVAANQHWVGDPSPHLRGLDGHLAAGWSRSGGVAHHVGNHDEWV